VLDDEIGSDRARRHARTAARIIEVKMVKPSLDPMRSSLARSGCGIKPITLRPWLSTPAISRIDPLGYPGSGRRCGLRPRAGPRCARRRCSSPRRGQWKAEDFALVGSGSEGRVGGLGAQMDVAANELETAVRMSAPGSRPASTRIWNRCTRRARGRHRARTGERPSSPERIWRWRRSAGSP